MHMSERIIERRQFLKQAAASAAIGLTLPASRVLGAAKQWLKDGLAGKITHIETWMSRNTPRGQGQWVRPIPSDCTASNVKWEAFLNGRSPRPFDAFKFINWRLYW